MEDDDRVRPRPSESDLGAASLLASESLERYSLEDLDARIALLDAEIDRIRSHRRLYAAHKLAAEALFRPKTP